MGKPLEPRRSPRHKAHLLGWGRLGHTLADQDLARAGSRKWTMTPSPSHRLSTAISSPASNSPAIGDTTRNTTAFSTLDALIASRPPLAQPGLSYRCDLAQP